MRSALRDAHATYRRFSGADVPVAHAATPSSKLAEPAPLPAPDPTPPVAATPARSLVRRARAAARPLRERLPSRPAADEQPDVLLDVQNLRVDEIDLQLEELKAHVALSARVMDLLHLDVGVDADLRGVGLKIKGVEAQALLKVRLENLAVIVDRVMDTVDANPQLLASLGAALSDVGAGTGRALGEVGEAAGSAVRDVGGLARAVVPPPAS
jgi:hypothetical protein